MSRDRRPDAIARATCGERRGLSADIRLLGRLLGDVVRRQAGDDAFDLVESVRRVAVDRAGAGASDVDGARGRCSTDRSIDEQLHVIRAFDWLALLANTAEDVHLERRRRHHRVAGSPSRPGSLAASFDRLVRRRRARRR